MISYVCSFLFLCLFVHVSLHTNLHLFPCYSHVRWTIIRGDVSVPKWNHILRINLDTRISFLILPQIMFAQFKVAIWKKLKSHIYMTYSFWHVFFEYLELNSTLDLIIPIWILQFRISSISSSNLWSNLGFWPSSTSAWFFILIAIFILASLWPFGHFHRENCRSKMQYIKEIKMPGDVH